MPTTIEALKAPGKLLKMLSIKIAANLQTDHTKHGNSGNLLILKSSFITLNLSI